ncbi:MAG: prepilin-type N-terminal cleavage/methylation domain-containing protein [Betaproteobacteria bacterium]|nr:prepilin-type N-terminal cleavage/methylation domain-containing protein [Betaproteobacteria bacterium]
MIRTGEQGARSKEQAQGGVCVLHLASKERGFTLVEMIMVIVITGIIGGIVAIFIRAPVQGYVDSARRAEMTDIADTALRRITRDLRLALPNSVRVNTSGAGVSTIYYLDFLSTSGGGRYRAAGTGTVYCAAAAPTNYDALLFTVTDTCFEILGPQMQFQANDQVVIYNLGIPGADAYEGNTAATHVRRAYAGATAAPVSFVLLASANPFPFESPLQRFQVVHEQTRYICDPVAHTLTRYWWAGNAVVVPSATVPSGVGVGSALLATNVSTCKFTYDANVVAQRSGLVTMNLGITESNETVTLYSAAHVSNVP